MSNVKGQAHIHYVKQGDTLTCDLRSTFPLKQFISNGSGAIAPSFAANKPCIYPVVRSSLTATRVQVETVGCKWRYNTVELKFDNSGLSLAMGAIPAGTFKSEWKTVDGFGVPTLIVCKELASAGNIDSDTIEISIEQTDGEAFIAYISVNNGGVIDDTTLTLTAKAHLLIGGTEQSSGVTYAWYKMVVQNGADGWQSINKTASSITINAADISSSELYKCTITSSGKTADAVIEVADETDVLIIYPNPTDGSGHSVAEELSSVQTSIVYAPKVYKRATSEEVSGYRFNYLLTNSSGDEMASQDGGATFTVTVSHAQKANGDLTLIISAEK